MFDWIKKHKMATAVLATMAALLLSLGISFAAYSPGFGDAGGFSGSHSYGGSSHSSSSHSSSSSSSSHSYGSSSSSGGDVGLEDLVILIVIVVIVIVVPAVSKKGKSSSKSQPAGAQRTPSSMLHPISELQAKDPAFSQAAIEQHIANVYVRMQQNWTAKNFEPMRPYFSNQLFSQFSNQLNQMKNAGQTNYVTNIAVLSVNTQGWYESQGKEHLVLEVRTRITDWTQEDKTGRIISGYKDAESFMTYEYTLERTSGAKTYVMENQTVSAACPHCGAPINLAQSAKCPYCDSVIESKEYTWVIAEIKGISQQIVGH